MGWVRDDYRFSCVPFRVRRPGSNKHLPRAPRPWARDLAGGWRSPGAATDAWTPAAGAGGMGENLHQLTGHLRNGAGRLSAPPEWTERTFVGLLTTALSVGTLFPTTYPFTGLHDLARTLSRRRKGHLDQGEPSLLLASRSGKHVCTQS